MQSADVEKEYAFAKKEYRVLISGRIVMGLFLIAGLFGLFGKGLSGSKTAEAKNFTAEYDDYLRYSMSSEVIIYPKRLLKDSSIAINSNYVKKIKISFISPQPQSTEENNGELIFKFTSPQVKQIILYLEPIKSGNQELEIRVNDEKQAIKQFTYF